MEILFLIISAIVRDPCAGDSMDDYKDGIVMISEYLKLLFVLHFYVLTQNIEQLLVNKVCWLH